MSKYGVISGLNDVILKSCDTIVLKTLPLVVRLYVNGGTGDVVSKRKIEIHFSLLMSISANLISYEKQKV